MSRLKYDILELFIHDSIVSMISVINSYAWVLWVWGVLGGGAQVCVL